MISPPAAAKIAANQLADLLDKYQIPYPVAYDFEDNQYLDTAAKASNTAICKAFLETLQGRGYYATLYTYTSFAKSFLNMEELFAYDFWVADYTGKVGWIGEYGMWQYSGSGTAPGVSTPVDLDHAYKDYPPSSRRRDSMGTARIRAAGVSQGERMAPTARGRAPPCGRKLPLSKSGTANWRRRSVPSKKTMTVSRTRSPPR